MMAKRPCVILVADSNMAATFRGYFKREKWHLSIGCAPFAIDTSVGGDLIVDEGGNDPGVYTKGHLISDQPQPREWRQRAGVL